MKTIAIFALWIANAAAQTAFKSPPEAAQTLFQAVQSNNEQAIATILGSETELTSSRDPGQDKVDRELFIQKYQEMHRLRREADGSVLLYIGAENWPFPVPLVNKNGSWRFDSDAGKTEVLLRRIGQNELITIANCRDFDGARGPASGGPILVNGYYFRVLPLRTRKGDTAGVMTLIAYPAAYRSSGVMTFVATKDGVVYEKDLGANTATLASTMAAFHKDSTWRQTTE